MSRAIFLPSKLIEKRHFVFAIEQKSRELLEEWENPTIDILLCADKNDAVVRYTLPENEKQIFASNYKLYLPTESEIVAEINSEQAAAGFEPLREAIEFAVTLPENVSVIIRGFWLWLEGKTYLCKDRIKSFEGADGIRFRWSKNKTAWYFAAVPSSNKSGKLYSFEEIEAIYGREVISERVRQTKIAA